MARVKFLGLALVSIAVFTTIYLLAFGGDSLGARTWHIEDDILEVPPLASGNSTHNGQQDLTAGNSTLGFQAILALSQGTKWRVDGLQAAANASGIDLLIPAQPGWSDEFIKSFEAFGPVDAHGAAMAWLGHIDLLKFVIQNRWGSALIMEDDVDWDVGIREQTRMIAKGVRELTNKGWGLPWGKEKDIGFGPYGQHWDILWMGHCSDPPDTLKPIVSWSDPSVISWDKYVGIDRYVTTVQKEGERSVHRSFNPVCTFAYAVSARGARKLLKAAATGRGGAFDLMLNRNCKEGVLECITVNPEIFDSYHPAGGDVSEVRAGDAHGAGKGSFDTGVGQDMGHTDNILQSARCQALWGSTCLTNA